MGPSASSSARRHSTLWPVDYDIGLGHWLPLDGEEGELVEDEGFLDSTIEPPPADHGIPFPSHSTLLPSKKFDIVSHLPPELALHIFSYIVDLDSLASIARVSKYWNVLGSDTQIWRDMFMRRNGEWVINPTRAAVILKRQLKTQQRVRMDSQASNATARSSFISPAILYNRWGRNSLLSLRSLNRKAASEQATSSSSYATSPYIEAPPLTLDWKSMFRSRFEIDQRWTSLDWEPRTTYFKGHSDSVYCVEIDAARSRLMTASRDRTLIVWSLHNRSSASSYPSTPNTPLATPTTYSVSRSPRLATLIGHRASVLCFKFDEDFLVSCGSDHALLVWDLSEVKEVEKLMRGDEGNGEYMPLMIKPKRELRGHEGSVLDLKMDEDIIVSWYALDLRVLMLPE